MNSDFVTDILEPAILSIKEVYMMFINVPSVESPLPPTTPEEKSVETETRKFFGFFFKKKDTKSLKETLKKTDLAKELDDEIELFKDLISNNNFWKNFESSYENSSDFWKESKTLPKLADLFFKLNTIPATSASIERFFSIAGIVNDKRRLRMMDDLIIQRTMIKSNMELLENFSKKSFG
jgi:hypothetical protein